MRQGDPILRALGLASAALVTACAGRAPVEAPRPDSRGRIEASATEPAAAAGVARPAFSGVWVGRSSRQQCTEAGGAIGVACGSLPRGQPIRLELVQTGAQTEGVLVLGSLRAEVAGAVDDDGILRLVGQQRGASHTITLSAWESRVDGSRMDGTFRYVITADDQRLGSASIVAAFGSARAQPRDTPGDGLARCLGTCPFHR